MIFLKKVADLSGWSATVPQCSIEDNLCGGYALMPEWGTKPANHYLPRRKIRFKVYEDESARSSRPLVRNAG